MQNLNTTFGTLMKANTQSEQAHWMLFISIVGAVTFAGYFVLYPQTLFKPGAHLFDLGYNLGLTGGVMMLILLLYPVRKRVKLFANFGPLPIWFKYHMVLGILGPLTIIFHSTYHVYIPYFHPSGSPNAAVAMFSMLLVSGSGVFGRFFYTKIHHGLYGRQATLNEIQAELESPGNLKSLFDLAPSIEKTLEDFRDLATSYTKRPENGLVNFLAVGWRTIVLSRSLSNEIHRIMHAQASQDNLNAAQRASMEDLILDYHKHIASYLKAVRNFSQFSTYERMFSWWHIFHIPLVYTMVISVLYHVYAVHAY